MELWWRGLRAQRKFRGVLLITRPPSELGVEEGVDRVVRPGHLVSEEPGGIWEFVGMPGDGRWPTEARRVNFHQGR
jgi:hypothetical protein